MTVRREIKTGAIEKFSGWASIEKAGARITYLFGPVGGEGRASRRALCRALK